MDKASQIVHKGQGPNPFRMYNCLYLIANYSEV